MVRGFLRWTFVTVPLVLLIGIVSSQLVPNGNHNGWYRALAKPSATPPAWMFPVAWTILYVLQGIAAAMILNARGAPGKALALGLFAAQLALNASWTPVFFGAHQVGAGLAIIVAMLALAIAATVTFGRIRTAAAWLMVPYLVWLCYAGMLNLGIWRLNPDASARLVPDGSVTQMIN